MTRDNPKARKGLLILAAHNVVQNSILNEAGYVTGNLAVTATLVGLGRQAGLDWEEMGLGSGELRQSLRLGAAVSLTSAAFLALVPRLRAVRPHLRDERAPSGTRRETMRRAFVRFPFGTALFEEVVFRGVLPPLLAQEGRRGDLTSSLVFGLWHLIPTHHALTVNGVGESGQTRVAGTLAGAAAAAVGGYALSRLRRRTGSLLAPWLIHSALNTTSFLAVMRVHPERIRS